MTYSRTDAKRNVIAGAVALSPTLGRLLYWFGTGLASVVDVPAVLDPAELRAGRALGFPAMVPLSAGLQPMGPVPGSALADASNFPAGEQPSAVGTRTRTWLP